MIQCVRQKHVATHSKPKNIIAHAMKLEQLSLEKIKLF